MGDEMNHCNPESFLPLVLKEAVHTSKSFLNKTC